MTKTLQGSENSFVLGFCWDIPKTDGIKKNKKQKTLTSLSLYLRVLTLLTSLSVFPSLFHFEGKFAASSLFFFCIVFTFHHFHFPSSWRMLLLLLMVKFFINYCLLLLLLFPLCLIIDPLQFLSLVCSTMQCNMEAKTVRALITDENQIQCLH